MKIPCKRCAYVLCRKRFKPSNNKQEYCCPACQNKASKYRAHHRVESLKDPSGKNIVHIQKSFGFAEDPWDSLRWPVAGSEHVSRADLCPMG